MMKDKSGLLVGKKEICQFLNGATEHQVKKWAADGMPVRITGGDKRGRGAVWLAHKKNLEEFFMAYTRVDPNSSVASQSR